MTTQLRLTAHRERPTPADALLAQLRTRGVELWIDAGRVRHRAPTGAMTMSMLLALKDAEAAVLATLARDAANVATEHDVKGAGRGHPV